MGKPSQIEITCRQVWREISNYYEGDVPADLRERIKRHLADCRHCRAVYDGMRNTVSLVTNQRALELPRALSQRLHERLKLHLARKSRPVGDQNRFWS